MSKNETNPKSELAGPHHELPAHEEPNVRSMKNRTTATLADAEAWIRARGERGDFKATTARHYMSAINSLTDALVEDEPRLATYLHDNVDDIASRWVRKTNGNPETATTYRMRIKKILGEYLRYLDDPLGYRPVTRETPRARKDTDDAPSRRSAVNDVVVQEHADHELELPLQPGRNRGNYRFPDGRVAEFVVPSDLKMLDVVRLAAHLMTTASDWDGRMLTLAVTELGSALTRRDE